MTARVESPALLLRSVAYGESDLVATFFTRDAGTMPAIARGARRSQKRFGGAIEPIHGLFVTLEDRGRELCVLKEARVERPRTRVTTSLDAMEAAGQALRWVRHVCPARTPEPAAWASLVALLDELDEGAAAPASGARARLAHFGLRLLTDMGYGLELDRCIRCGRPCPEGRSAFLDATRGGIVCTSCGGASRTVSSELRGLASRAARADPVLLPSEAAGEIIAIVEEALAAHAGFSLA